jgi:hypothetical protein
LLRLHQIISPGLTFTLFCNVIRFHSEELLAPRSTPRLDGVPCQLSVTAYSTYLQLPSILEAVPPTAT